MTEQSADGGAAVSPRASGRWLLGNAMIAAGVGWLIVDRVLVFRYPLQWSGPNFGAGALVLVAYSAVLAGVLILVAAGITLVRERPASRPVRARWVVPAGGNVLLVAVLIAVLVSLPGRSETRDTIGAVGVTVTASGSPVLVLEVCRGSVDTVSVAGPNLGREPNEEFARWTSQVPVAASSSIDVARPASPWTGSPLPPTTAALLTAVAGGPEGSLLQVSFTPADLAALDPATVLSSGTGPDGSLVGRRTPVAGFRALACAHLPPAAAGG